MDSKNSTFQTRDYFWAAGFSFWGWGEYKIKRYLKLQAVGLGCFLSIFFIWSSHPNTQRRAYREGLIYVVWKGSKLCSNTYLSSAHFVPFTFLTHFFFFLRTALSLTFVWLTTNLMKYQYQAVLSSYTVCCCCMSLALCTVCHYYIKVNTSYSKE